MLLIGVLKALFLSARKHTIVGSGWNPQSLAETRKNVAGCEWAGKAGSVYFTNPCRTA
jgi:hypothetical protein